MSTYYATSAMWPVNTNTWTYTTGFVDTLRTCSFEELLQEVTRRIDQGRKDSLAAEAFCRNLPQFLSEKPKSPEPLPGKPDDE